MLDTLWKAFFSPGENVLRPSAYFFSHFISLVWLHVSVFFSPNDLKTWLLLTMEILLWNKYEFENAWRSESVHWCEEKECLTKDITLPSILALKALYFFLWRHYSMYSRGFFSVGVLFPEPLWIKKKCTSNQTHGFGLHPSPEGFLRLSSLGLIMPYKAWRMQVLLFTENQE